MADLSQFHPIRVNLLIGRFEPIREGGKGRGGVARASGEGGDDGGDGGSDGGLGGAASWGAEHRGKTGWRG